jgi:hypothetical protein
MDRRGFPYARLLFAVCLTDAAAGRFAIPRSIRLISSPASTGSNIRPTVDFRCELPLFEA